MALTWVLGSLTNGSVDLTPLPVVDGSDSVSTDIHGQGKADITVMMHELTHNARNEWTTRFVPWRHFLALVDLELKWNHVGAVAWAGPITNVQVDIGTETLRISATELADYLDRRRVVDIWNREFWDMREDTIPDEWKEDGDTSPTFQDERTYFEWWGAGWRDIVIKIIRAAFYVDVFEKVPSNAPRPPKVMGSIPKAYSGRKHKRVLRAEGRTYGELLREVHSTDSPNGLEYRFRPRFHNADRKRIVWDVLVGTDDEPHINESNTYGIHLQASKERLSSFTSTTTSENLYTKLYIQELEQNSEFVVWDKIIEDHAAATVFPILLEEWLETEQPLTSTEVREQMDLRIAHAAKPGEEVTMEVEEQWGVGRWAPRLGGTLILNGVNGTKSAGIKNVVRVVGYTINPSDGTCSVSVMSPQPVYPKLPGRPLERPDRSTDKKKGKTVKDTRKPVVRGRITKYYEDGATTHFTWTPVETEQDIRWRTNVYEWQEESGQNLGEDYIEIMNPGWAELKVRQRMHYEDGSSSEWSEWSETVRVEAKEDSGGGPGGPGGPGDRELEAPEITRAEQKDTRAFFQFSPVMGANKYSAQVRKNDGEWDIPDIQEPRESIAVEGKEGDTIEFRVRAVSKSDEKSEWATATVTMVGMPGLPEIIEWKQEGPNGVMTFRTPAPDAAHVVEYRITNGEWAALQGGITVVPPEPEEGEGGEGEEEEEDTRHVGTAVVPAPDDSSLQARLKTVNVAGESDWVFTEYIPIAEPPVIFVEQYSAPQDPRDELPEWMDVIVPPSVIPFKPGAQFLINFSQSDTAESTRIEARLSDEDEWVVLEGLEPNAAKVKNLGQLRDEIPEALVGNIVSIVGNRTIQPGDELQVRGRAEHEDGFSDWATKTRSVSGKPDAPDIYSVEQQGSWAIFKVRPGEGSEETEFYSGDYRINSGEGTDWSEWIPIGSYFDPKEPFDPTPGGLHKEYQADEDIRVLGEHVLDEFQIEVRIRARNVSGFGLYSMAEITMEEPPPPDAPEIVKAEANGEQVVFQFAEVPGARGYQALYRINGEGEDAWNYADGYLGAWSELPNEPSDSLPGKLYIYNVQYGDTVEFMVGATNLGGWGEFSVAEVKVEMADSEWDMERVGVVFSGYLDDNTLRFGWYHGKYQYVQVQHFADNDGRNTSTGNWIDRTAGPWNMASYDNPEWFGGLSYGQTPESGGAYGMSIGEDIGIRIRAVDADGSPLTEWAQIGPFELNPAKPPARTIVARDGDIIDDPHLVSKVIPEEVPEAPEWVDVYTNDAGDSGVVVYSEVEAADSYELQYRVDGGDWEDADYDHKPMNPVAVGDITEQVVELRVRAVNLIGAGEWSTIAEFESVLDISEDLPMPVIHGRKDGENAIFYYEGGEYEAPRWWGGVDDAIPDEFDEYNPLPDRPTISASSFQVRLRIEGSDPRELEVPPGEEYVVDRITGARVVFEVRAHYSDTDEGITGWSPWASRVIHG